MMGGDEEVLSAWQGLGGSEMVRMDEFCDKVARAAKEGWEGVGMITLV